MDEIDKAFAQHAAEKSYTFLREDFCRGKAGEFRAGVEWERARVAALSPKPAKPYELIGADPAKPGGDETVRTPEIPETPKGTPR